MRTGAATRSTQPALPLYTETDAARALMQLQPVGYDRPSPSCPASRSSSSTPATCSARRTRACRVGGRDDPVRRRSRPLQPARASGPDAGRRRPMSCSRIHLRRSRCTRPTTTGAARRRSSTTRSPRGGKLIIPSFAIGRVEEVLYWLKRSSRNSGSRYCPCSSTARWPSRRSQFYDARTQELDAGMAPAKPGGSRAFATTRLTRVSSPQQSADLVASQAAGNRHRCRAAWPPAGGSSSSRGALPNAADDVLFVGYQAAGTRGRQLVDGAKAVRIRAATCRSPRIDADRLDVGARGRQRNHALAVRASRVRRR